MKVEKVNEELMKEDTKDKIRVLRCEHQGCRQKLSKGRWIEGWTQGGVSRFGKRYDPDEIASWCPIHKYG